MRATGLWGHPDVPQTGWTCIKHYDLGSPQLLCQMCERQEIRYVHIMQHPKFNSELGVGCVCAGHMEGDLEAAHLRELGLKRKPKTVLDETAEQNRDWIEAADKMLKCNLTVKEREFISDMQRRFKVIRYFEPTERQTDWFVAIYKRVVQNGTA